MHINRENPAFTCNKHISALTHEIKHTHALMNAHSKGPLTWLVSMATELGPHNPVQKPLTERGKHENTHTHTHIYLNVRMTLIALKTAEYVAI